MEREPLNEIKLIDNTKTMFSLRKAKPEKFSPSERIVFRSYFTQG